MLLHALRDAAAGSCALLGVAAAESRSWAGAVWVALLEPVLPAAAAVELESRSGAGAVWVALLEPVLPAAAAVELESRSGAGAVWVALLEPELPVAACGLPCLNLSCLQLLLWKWSRGLGPGQCGLVCGNLCCLRLLVWRWSRGLGCGRCAALEVESRTRVWAVWAALLQAPRLGIQLQSFGTKVGMTAALLGLLGEAGIVLPLIQPAWLP